VREVAGSSFHRIVLGIIGRDKGETRFGRRGNSGGRKSVEFHFLARPDRSETLGEKKVTRGGKTMEVRLTPYKVPGAAGVTKKVKEWSKTSQRPFRGVSTQRQRKGKSVSGSEVTER